MLIIGHRGAKGLAPENTKASFEAALEHNVGAIEFDVRTTKDNVAIVWHDEFLKIKKKKVNLEIVRTDYIALQQANPELLTLAEALDFINCRVPVVIEVKPESDISPVLKEIEHALASGWIDENVSVSSFSYTILENIQRVLPDIRLIVNEKWSGVRAGRRARKLKTPYVTMDHRWLWSGFIKAVVRNNTKLTAYTVNNPRKAEKWSRLGLHAVVTDYPDRFNKVS